MRMQRIMRIVKYLNPKDLAKEVHVYGYDFSWKRHLMILLGAVLLMSLIAGIYRLDVILFAVIILILLITLPSLILNTYKRMFEQKRFEDASVYAEQMLYSFQKNGKIMSSLQETSELFAEGRMKWAIEDAIHYLETGIARTKAGTLREALSIVEKVCICKEIHLVHELLLGCEEHGGDAQKSIVLLLEDIELWKRRCYRLQADKKICHADNVTSIGVAMLLCAIALFVLDTMGRMFQSASYVSIFSNIWIQWSSFLFLTFMIKVFSVSMKRMSADWIQERELQNETYLLSCYQQVIRDERRGRRHFGYRMARKDVSNALYIILPQWMMEMALLLQHNNVQVSIEKSIQSASPLLKAELRQLQERLRKNPDKLRSYTDFCKDFDVPEIQSVMKMLHAISESGTGNADIQMHNLLKRVQEMQDMAEAISNKQILFRMRMIFTYPVLAATLKLMADLTVGMLYMLKLLGNLGGG